MEYRLLYSDTSRRQLRGLRPETKAVVRSRLQRLKDEPFMGKRLERELSGYWSLRAKRFRIIYRVRETEQIVEIHHIGHRRDIYELFRETVSAV